MYNVPVCFFLLAELLAFNCTEENTHVPGYMIHLSAAKIQYSSTCTVSNLDMYYIHGTHMYVNK